MQWLTPEDPSEPAPSGDPASPVPPPVPDPGPTGGSDEPTGPIPQEAISQEANSQEANSQEANSQEEGAGPVSLPATSDPTGPLPVVGSGAVAPGIPAWPLPSTASEADTPGTPGWSVPPGSGGAGAPGSPGWSPPTGGGGGAVPPWGWSSGGWPGGYYGGPPNPPRRRRTGLVIAALLAGLLLAGGGIGAGLTLAFAGGSGPSHVAAPPPTKNGRVNAAAIAARVDEGVVDITAQEAYSQNEAEGTGMVLTSNGEVLTNNHVVDGASSISVRPVDGQKSYSASVVGVDPTADVALLQLHGASGLKTVPLGNSSKVKVGNAVVAIGNAGGLGGKPTVTQGTVTALNRSVTASDANGANPENLTGMLQSSAPLASGDSGGPLVNSAGKVVGMDTAAPSGGVGPGTSSTESVGWAIPINKALSVVSLVRSGSSNPNILLGARPFIGVSVEDASQVSQGQSPFGGFPGRFNQLPLPAVSSGAYVSGVISDPAESAGLQTGDVITSFDGHTVSTDQDLSNVENTLHPGDSVNIGWVDTSGQSHSATITLGTGPAV